MIYKRIIYDQEVTSFWFVGHNGYNSQLGVSSSRDINSGILTSKAKLPPLIKYGANYLWTVKDSPDIYEY